ncbi:MAG TPA: SRPBCC family protein [Kofleriaceae bacterium]|nr:SRPBCC family protein [Kofleriaceae bacterium]
MIWIAYAAGGLVGLVVLMALIGLFLPRGHVTARRCVLARPPEAVWAALVDLDAQPRWRRGLKRLERLDERRFRETTRQGAITFELLEERPRELRITRIADDALPFGGRWIYELHPEGDSGTRLTITEDGFIKNPVFRFLAATVFSTSATLEAFLGDLAAHLGVAAVIEPAAPSPLAISRT